MDEPTPRPPADPTLLPDDAATLPPPSPRAADTLRLNTDPSPTPISAGPTLPPEPGWMPSFDAPAVDWGRVALPEIAGYEVIEEIGRGGMGVVYKARHVGLNRPCALKMFLGEHAGTAGAIRFRHEAETVARLHHPNIVLVHAIGVHQGRPFVELEYLDGGSLADRIEGKPWPAEQAAAMVEAIARAVGEAHRLGIIHRDLKPANTLLAKDGTPKVADFGLAKTLDSESYLTLAGALMGTPEYMAPEQTTGKDVSPATDVHALGVILYELLVGNRPFLGATLELLLARIESADPVPPGQIVAGTPRDLETICLKCLHKESAKRYSNAAELSDDIHLFRSHRTIRARRPTSAERAANWVRRNKKTAVMIAVVIAAVLLGFAGTTVGLAIAVNSERSAIKQAEFANQRLYCANLNIVQQAWENWNQSLFFSTREEQCPKYQHGIDRRGFEWYYWHEKITVGHQTLTGHSGLVAGVAYSPDGRRLASAGYDKSVRVWDAVTGKEIMMLEGHMKSVRGVAFSPDGRRLASAGSDDSVRVWDAESGQGTLTLLGHSGAVTAVAFSPDGRRLASASMDNSVRIWEASPNQAGQFK